MRLLQAEMVLAGAIGARPEGIARFLDNFTSESVQASISENLVAGWRHSHDVRSAIKTLLYSTSAQVRRRLSRHVVVLAAGEGMQLPSADLEQLTDLYSSVYKVLYAPQTDTSTLEEPSLLEDRSNYSVSDMPSTVGQYVHDLFFFLLIRELRCPGSVEHWLSPTGISGWLSIAITRLAEGAIEIASAWRNDREFPVAKLYNVTSGLDRPHWMEDMEEGHRAEGFQIALRTITEDLLVLRGAGEGHSELSWTEVETIAAHRFASFGEILRWNADGSLPVTRDGIESLCSSLEEELSHTIESFGARAETFALLAIVCARNGLNDKAKSYLYKAAENLMGYGYHKDSLLETALDTVEIIAGHREVTPDTWFRLAPAIAAINEFTDGDHTSHLPSRLGRSLLGIEPALAVNYLKELMDSEQYGHVESILNVLARDGDLEDPVVKALVSTCISPDSIRIIEERANNSDQSAREMLDLPPGFSSTYSRRESDSSGTSGFFPGDSDAMSEFAGPEWHLEFPPERFHELVNNDALSTPTKRSDVLSIWLCRWLETALACDALDIAESHFMEDGRLEVSNQMVNAVQSVSGRSRSYAWIVRSQQSKNGWWENWEDFEEVTWRWEWMKDNFPDRWHCFLIASSRPRRGLSPAFGMTFVHLVRYLVYFERFEYAHAATIQLTETVSDLVSGQDLPVPYWIGEGGG